jgi:hypothetical protein
VARKKQALQALYASLTADTALTDLLGHAANSTTIKNGARIVGDTVKLRPHPVPLLVFGLGAGDKGGKGGPSIETTTWDIPLVLFYTDVWQGADILDALTDWVARFRSSAGVISKLEYLGHQAIDLEPEQDPEFLAQQALIRLHMVR